MFKFSIAFALLLLSIVKVSETVGIDDSFSTNSHHNIESVLVTGVEDGDNVSFYPQIYHSRKTEEKEEPLYMKDSQPLFEVLLVSICVNFFALAAMLVFLPFLNNRNRFHPFKSFIWEACRLMFNGELLLTASSEESDEYQESFMQKKHTWDLLIPAFVCGLTLSTIFFLIAPEAIMLIQEGQGSNSLSDGELGGYGKVLVQFAMLSLTGFITPQIFTALLPRLYEYSGYEEIDGDEEEFIGAGVSSFDIPQEEEEEKEEENENFMENSNANKEEEHSADDLAAGGSTFDCSCQPYVTYRTFYILLRDAFINFIQGLFIGTAYMTCSNALAIMVTILIIIQRVTSDAVSYVLLTKHIGMFMSNALLANVWCGLTLVGGAMIMLGGGFDASAAGMMLAVCGGYFLYNATNYYLLRMLSIMKIGMKDGYSVILVFTIAALTVGLTILGPNTCKQVRISTTYS